jgi:hypothetical protein
MNMSTDAGSEKATEESVAALAPAGTQQIQTRALPFLPHEDETDFDFIRRELENELAGPWLGFGRKLAHEAAIARRIINRLRQALNASTWAQLAPRQRAVAIDFSTLSRRHRPPAENYEKQIAELEARVRSWQPLILPTKLEVLERELRPLLASETRRYEGIVALINFLHYAAQHLSAMEGNAPDAIAAHQKCAEAHSRPNRGTRPQNIYVDDHNKLTKHARRIMGEPSLIRGDCLEDYHAAVIDVIAILGNGRGTNLLSAVDIVNDTWQVLRLLELREKELQAAFKATLRKLTGNQSERENEIDSERALAITFHEHLSMMIEYDRLIDPIYRDRKRSIDNAIKRNAMRLRTIWMPTSEIKLIK